MNNSELKIRKKIDGIFTKPYTIPAGNMAKFDKEEIMKKRPIILINYIPKFIKNGG